MMNNILICLPLDHTDSGDYIKYICACNHRNHLPKRCDLDNCYFCDIPKPLVSLRCDLENLQENLQHSEFHNSNHLESQRNENEISYPIIIFILEKVSAFGSFYTSTGVSTMR